MMMLSGDFTSDPNAVPHRGDAEMIDAQLYLRHVEQGETIRSLARQAGCHPSTILRRIRRFEQRRDDPLVDGALTPRAAKPENDARDAMRVLRRLAEPGALLVTADNMEKAIVTRDDIRTAVLDRRLAETMALRGWLVAQAPTGRVHRYIISNAGRDALRAMLRSPRQRNAILGDGIDTAEPVTPDAQPFADQHRVYENRMIQDPEDGRRRHARCNIAESPMLILARRRDHDGNPFLTPDMVTAGERLREDFELAQMGPRVTQNWDGFLTSGVDVSRGLGGTGGGSDKARNRVALALRELGPGMGDIALRVCCFLEGIEMTERRLGWSARSGKIVLRLALMRLQRHYDETYGKGAPLIG